MAGEVLNMSELTINIISVYIESFVFQKPPQNHILNVRLSKNQHQIVNNH